MIRELHVTPKLSSYLEIRTNNRKLHVDSNISWQVKDITDPAPAFGDTLSQFHSHLVNESPASSQISII